MKKTNLLTLLLLILCTTLSISNRSYAQEQLFTANDEDCPNCLDSLVAPFNVINYNFQTIKVIYVNGKKTYNFGTIDDSVSRKDESNMKNCFHVHDRDSSVGIIAFKLKFNPDSILRKLNPWEYFIRILAYDSSNNPLSYTTIDFSTLQNKSNYPLSSGWQRLLHENPFRNRWEGEFDIYVALNGAKKISIDLEVGYSFISGQNYTQNSGQNTVVKYNRSQKVMEGSRCVNNFPWWLPSPNRFGGTGNRIESELIISPNPVGKTLNVKIPIREEVWYKVSIHNIHGGLLIEKEILSTLENSGGKIHIPNLDYLPVGIYILELESKNSHFFKKFVKE